MSRAHNMPSPFIPHPLAPCIRTHTRTQWRCAACSHLPVPRARMRCRGRFCRPKPLSPPVPPTCRCELDATVDMAAAIGGGGRLEAAALYVCPQGRRFALCGHGGTVHMLPVDKNGVRIMPVRVPLPSSNPLPAFLPGRPTQRVDPSTHRTLPPSTPRFLYPPAPCKRNRYCALECVAPSQANNSRVPHTQRPISEDTTL